MSSSFSIENDLGRYQEAVDRLVFAATEYLKRGRTAKRSIELGVMLCRSAKAVGDREAEAAFYDTFLLPFEDHLEAWLMRPGD